MDAERTRAMVGEYFQRLLNERDLSVCDELLAANYRDHDAPPESPPGPASTKAFVETFLDDYPDLVVRIEEMVVEASTVAARITWRGNHKSTGVELWQMGLVLLRIDDAGHFAERWSAYTPLRHSEYDEPSPSR